jgi:hypothetical protein
MTLPEDPHAPLPGQPARLPSRRQSKRRSRRKQREHVTPPGFASRFFALLAIVGVITAACSSVPQSKRPEVATNVAVCTVQDDALSIVVRDPIAARSYFQSLAVRLKEGDPSAPDEAGDLIFRTLECLP